MIVTGSPTPPYLSAYLRVCEQHARRALGEEGYESAFEDGIEMSRDDAVAYTARLGTEIVPRSGSLSTSGQRKGWAP